MKICLTRESPCTGLSSTPQGDSWVAQVTGRSALAHRMLAQEE